MSRIGPLFQGSTPSHDYGYVDFGVDFELEAELAEALEKYHRLAAERAQRLADQVDRSLFTMVHPITKKPLDFEVPESVTSLITTGPYQNAAEWNPAVRTGNLLNPLQTYAEFIERLPASARKLCLK